MCDILISTSAFKFNWRRYTMGVPDALADFSLPLGATVNMNGTALYEAVTVLFIAQLHGRAVQVVASIKTRIESAYGLPLETRLS